MTVPDVNPAVSPDLPAAVLDRGAGAVAVALHSGIGRRTYLALHATATVVPLGVGVALYGWRGAGLLAMVVGSAIAACRIWRRIGRRGPLLRTGHIAWMALLLAMMLPAHLFADGTPAPWPLLPAAGLLLVIITWLLSSVGAGRLHPVLVTYLFLWFVFHGMLTPHHVLRVDRLFHGDLLKATAIASPVTFQPWYLVTTSTAASAEDAIDVEPAARQLLAHRASPSLDTLLRGQLPPLENLLVAGDPGPLGISSALAVLLGGLYLLYRGLIDYRIPLLGVFFAVVTLLVAPLPMAMTTPDTAWRSLAFGGIMGPAAAITFVNYEIAASPLLFALFFLATSPALRPMTRRGRNVYALALGVLAALFQLYASVAVGPYLAVMVVSLMTPTLDRIFRRRTLV